MRFLKSSSTFTAVVLWGLLSVQLSAQKIVGQLFTKADVTAAFGEITFSASMPTPDLQALLTKTDTYVLFKIIDSSIVILNNKRELLYPEGVSVPSEAPFKLYSVSKVQELIDKGGAETVSFETRDCIMTISDGDHILELGANCPPWCE